MDHMCKFCNKIFPCGRSLGGHMRTHLITVSSNDPHNRNPKKKLPPLTIVKKYDTFTDKPNRFLKSSEEDTLLEDKQCKECGQIFQSGKALFGHMKTHSDSSSYGDRKVIMDSQSDNEGTPNPVLSTMRKKRSERIKRYITYNNNNANSSSLSTSNFSTCVSEIDQQEQEELVALSLILLSRDTGDNRPCFDSIVESSDNSSKILDINSKNNHDDCLKFKKLSNGELEPTILNNSEKSMKKQMGFRNSDLKTNKFEVSADENRVEDESENKNLDCNESEVNSSKNLKNKNSKLDQFGSDLKKNKSRKRKPISIDEHDEKQSKFRCVICKKGFSSYQALGGHRASHKKFKGLCAPITKNDIEIENSPNLIAKNVNRGFELKKNRDHECPICFRIFSSGQALGGHKRSHLVGEIHAKNSTNNNSPSDDKQIPEIRNFLDLNMPAPVEEEEEECSEFDPTITIFLQ